MNCIIYYPKMYMYEGGYGGGGVLNTSTKWSLGCQDAVNVGMI